ncbi:DNA internalization-related competence protein ComEC/Rec2 [Oceanospirillum sediminis]|uniref:DNA internalization-related competence protein ComEC/Rec2 n=1 Tax=Oceanospirillum sediminis TaxID=2760088 RepID=A0A839IPR5_9GAMM|nr:DNA internalization-related competence protein ComEC/Rec2 [Oceanospirillum sediminis]MBB1487493.1 DNA internalization-related competence protein ComEC/Rec2 [Oceanospirillum sediminis]
MMWILVIISGLVAGSLDHDWPPAEVLLFLLWLSVALWRSASRTFSLLILSYLFSSLHLSYQLHQTLPVWLAGQDLQVSGQVTAVLPSLSGRQRFLFQVEHCQLVKTGEPCHFHGLIRSGWYQKEGNEPVNALRSGDHYQFQVRLFPVRGFIYSPVNLYRLKQWSQGIFARGYVRAEVRHHVQSKDSGYFNSILHRWRSLGLERIDQVSQDTEYINRQASEPDRSGTSLDGMPVYALMQALLAGNKAYISDQQWLLLQDTGTVHLVVISGLHLAVLMLLGVKAGHLLQSSGRYDRWWWIILFQCLPVILLLPALSLWPGGVAVQRALLMLGIWIGLNMLLISPSPWRVLWLAVIFLLMWNPWLIFQAGFYYSVAAVFLLLFFTGMVRSRTFRLYQLIHIQLVLFIGLSGMQYIWFNQSALSSLLANLLAIPLVTLVILPLSLLILVFPADNLMFVLNESVQLFWQWLKFCQQWTVYWPGSALSGIFLFCCALVLAIPGVTGRAPWLVIVFLVLFFRSDTRKSTPGIFRADVLDIGQGLSVLISTGDYRLLYDTGPGFRSGFAPIQLALLPELKRLRQAGAVAYPLNHLVISHDDNDHSGGLSRLEGWYQPPFYTGQPKRFNSVSSKNSINENAGSEYRADNQNYQRSVLCYAGHHWQVNQVRFEFLFPEPGDRQLKASDNNRSCVLKVSSVVHPDLNLLLPGDIDYSVESKLVNLYGDQLQSQWLVASHHGSHTGSSALFLNTVSPVGIIYSAGYKNRFGHPAAKVQRRSRQLGIQQYTTSDMGSVSLLPEVTGTEARFRVEYVQQQLPLRWLWKK